MPKTLNLKVPIVTEIPRVYEDFFFSTKLRPYFLDQRRARAGNERERQIVQDRLGLSLRGGNRGAFAGYHERGPQLLSKENRRKIEPKETSSCLIARLFFVFIRQLKILVTTLKFVIHEFLSMETAVLNYAKKVICEKNK